MTQRRKIHFSRVYFSIANFCLFCNGQLYLFFAEFLLFFIFFCLFNAILAILSGYGDGLIVCVGCATFTKTGNCVSAGGNEGLAGGGIDGVVLGLPVTVCSEGLRAGDDGEFGVGVVCF